MIEARDPRTGRIDHRVEPPDAAALDALGSRLRAAQASWVEAGVEGRTKVLSAWRDALDAHRSEIIEALVADTGRLTESGLEVDGTLRSIDRWCATAPELMGAEAPRSSAVPFVEVRQGWRPYALVGVISPWNFPLLLSVIDAIPALAAGCAVVVKPSEVTPRFIEPVMRTVAETGLGDVFAYVPGDGATGEALIDRTDLVCFTGSVATGRLVAERAARRLVPAFLELGGKDPAIVLASADLVRAVPAVVWAATANAGQSCQSIERVYVHRSLYEPFVSAVVEDVSRLRFAHPSPADGEIGPVIALKQVRVLEDHLADAEAKGATVRCGGTVERIDGGAWCRPTVLTEVDHSMKVMTEETFGPIIPIMAFDDTDQAGSLANDTIYGLSAAVFGEEGEALAVARRLDAGGISVNDASLTAFVHEGEKQSFRCSGLGGSRMGPAALRRFGRRQAHLVARNGGRDPWWYGEA